MQHPAPTAVCLLGLLALLGVRRWARRRLAVLGELVSRIRTDEFRHTAVAALLTLVIASAWPAILYFAGWLLAGAEDSPPFSQHVSVTLERTARLFAIFSAVRWFLAALTAAGTFISAGKPPGVRRCRRIRSAHPPTTRPVQVREDGGLAAAR